MSDQVQLKIGGTRFGGWKKLRAEVGIEQCAGAFELGVMDRWATQATPWMISCGDACDLMLLDQTVITGYVDTVKPSISTASHGIHVSGRDRTMDLVDCSAVYKSGQWKRSRLDRIVRDLAQPFDVEVVANADVGAAFDSFNIEEGERAYETIERAARMRGLLVTTDGSGRLILTRAATTKVSTALTLPGNVYSAGLDRSWKERYSQIVVKGQGKGNKDEFGAAVAHGSARSDDPSINRYRPLIVIAEQHGKGPTFAQRAEWERNVRRGRGTRATVVVQGWTMDDGSLWRPNTLVPVWIPYLGIDEELLIARCSYTLDDHGTFTELQLVNRRAFDVLTGVKGTRLGSRITGINGLEERRKHAKDKAARKTGDGAIIDLETGQQSGGNK